MPFENLRTQLIRRTSHILPVSLLEYLHVAEEQTALFVSQLSIDNSHAYVRFGVRAGYLGTTEMEWSLQPTTTSIAHSELPTGHLEDGIETGRQAYPAALPFAIQTLYASS